MTYRLDGARTGVSRSFHGLKMDHKGTETQRRGARALARFDTWSGSGHPCSPAKKSSGVYSKRGGNLRRSALKGALQGDLSSDILAAADRPDKGQGFRL